MLPEPELPSLEVFGFHIPSFMYLMLAGMVLCFFLAQRRVRALALDTRHSGMALLWITVGGFTGGHFMEAVAYQQERLFQDPLWLFMIWDGLASVGGFLGGTIALEIYCRRNDIQLLEYLDALVYGFAPGWILARGGCYSVHDHPGVHTDFFLAVEFPDGLRHDLGLYEAMLAAVITLVLYVVARRRAYPGWHTALVLFLYSPARFLLDFLRTADRTYFGLTAAQYMCVLMLAIAIVLVRRGRAARGSVDVALLEGAAHDGGAHPVDGVHEEDEPHDP